MLGNFNQQFNSIFGLRSHVQVAEAGATSFMYSSDDDEDEYLLEEEDELDLDEENTGSYHNDDQEFFDLQELDFEDQLR